ncbi:hypothetical protein CYMTET_37174 [Cymbomonas tetramitiformis]|uniref:Uncharacterized protein n=1 Tax=Cymbomonas tetramitiformis TaxID=36881 RepID=A0AAE0CG88_9CHLO|nr:hypothetical protein CYMTET_37175 [Cymbomonas tetramitiformis]KAK3253580.1 hypothetical protein CYMTET_37174 [Cymbomonas tetramitiformis]
MNESDLDYKMACARFAYTGDDAYYATGARSRSSGHRRSSGQGAAAGSRRLLLKVGIGRISRALGLVLPSPDPLVAYDKENKKALPLCNRCSSRRPIAGGIGVRGSSATAYRAPAVVSASGIQSDVAVSAYGFHVAVDSDGDDDYDVLAELHTITEKVHDVGGRRAGVSFSQASVPRPTQATVATVHGATASTSRSAGQVVPAAGGAWAGRDSPEPQDGVLNQVVAAT